MAALPSVSSIVWMTFWPASKARIEAIMSTIERAGSAPEPSSAPARTVPVAAPRRRAGDEGVAVLGGLVSVEDAERARVDLPSAPTP